jgi:acetyltransferase-like isoleucine patch superfamily enzyme
MKSAVRVAVKSWGYDLYLVLCNTLLALPGHRFRATVLESVARFSVGTDIAVQRGIRVTSRGGVEIGDGCQINRDVTLDGRGGLTLGRTVNVSPEVAFLTADHDPHSPAFEGRRRGITVGDRAWISTRAIILPGATIGEGALVAAGAVVHGTVPPWSIVAGNPATVIGERSREAQQTAGPPYRRFLH